MAITLAAASTAVLSWLIERIRFGRMVKAAEKIAAGDYTVEVPTSGGGLEERLGVAINGDLRLPGRYPRPGDDRPPDRRRQPPGAPRLLCSPRSSARHAMSRPLCVAFVDIDHFKAVNDSYGHAAGDTVLRGVAQTVAENLRASDLIGRYGGEEFMLILTETDVEEGARR